MVIFVAFELYIRVFLAYSLDRAISIYFCNENCSLIQYREVLYSNITYVRKNRPAFKNKTAHDNFPCYQLEGLSPFLYTDLL